MVPPDHWKQAVMSAIDEKIIHLSARQMTVKS